VPLQYRRNTSLPPHIPCLSVEVWWKTTFRWAYSVFQRAEIKNEKTGITFWLTFI